MAEANGGREGGSIRGGMGQSRAAEGRNAANNVYRAGSGSYGLGGESAYGSYYLERAYRTARENERRASEPRTYAHGGSASERSYRSGGRSEGSYHASDRSERGHVARLSEHYSASRGGSPERRPSDNTSGGFERDYDHGLDTPLYDISWAYDADVGEPMRVYASSSGQLAYKTDAEYRSARLAAQPARRPAPAPKKSAPPAAAPKPKKERVPLPELLKRNHFYSRAAACALVAAAALAAILALLGYEAISGAQKEINSLNEQIEQENRLLDELNMDYLFSLDVIAARNAAEAAGMSQASASKQVHP